MNSIFLGSHITKDGREYMMEFFPDFNIAKAFGPLSPEGHGTAHLAVEVKAESEEEARQKLIEALDKGVFWKKGGLYASCTVE